MASSYKPKIQMKVYIVDLKYPTSYIKHVMADIVITKKRIFAEHYGKRNILGCSAFLTFDSAKMKKIRQLEEFTKNAYCNRMFKYATKIAKNQLYNVDKMK